MTAPLTPNDCDLRDFPRMMIDITRLRQSAFDAMTDDGAWRAGLNLWFSAWHSVPAGSLDNDEGALTKASGLGRDVKAWRKIKAVVLRGWVECDDGRLYHPVVCEMVLESWIEKLQQRLSSGEGNAKRWGVDFDAAPVREAIELTAGLLRSLNPQSRMLVKLQRRSPKPSKRPPEEVPPGDIEYPDLIPPGQHRDAENVPAGSQGTETGIQTDIIDWRARLDEATAAAGDALDRTSTGLMHARDLRAFVDPASGEPCTWEEVMDAIRLCAARARTRGKPIRSWSWVKDDVLALRDKRLNAILPDPKPPHERPHSDAKFLARQANHAAAFEGAQRAAGRDWKP